MSAHLKELKVLFTSEARARVLARFLLNTQDRLYQGEVARLERLPVKAVQREVAKLVRFGLLKRAGASKRRRFFRANPEHPLYPEVKAILLKTLLLGSRVERLKKPPFTKIRCAFVFGSFAKAGEDRKSDIDIIVIGSISTEEWLRVVAGSRLTLDFRPESSIVMPEEEFRRRIGAREDFLTRVVAGPKIFLLGGQDELNRLGEGAKTAASQGHP